MKKTIMFFAVVSALFSAGAMAANSVNANGQADNSASTATLNFTGKVTSSLCQVNTSDLTKTISLGEVSQAVLNTDGAHSPSQSFTVGLSNCDPTVSNITYVIRDGNASPATGVNTSAGLIPNSGDTTASGVGVYVAAPEGRAIQIGENKNLSVVKDGQGQALSEQTISLAAYIKKVGAGAVTAGTVDAQGIMTIKATATGG